MAVPKRSRATESTDSGAQAKPREQKSGGRRMQRKLGLGPRGSAASVLFALGVIGVGFLAVPIMTTGAAYDLCQVVGWKHSLHAKPSEAKKFYAVIGGFTVLAMAMNFMGFNPMKALVFSGIVQGFSTPPLLLLIMLMTNNRKIMGDRVNSRGLNILGWVTTAAIFAATIGLIATWFV